MDTEEIRARIVAAAASLGDGGTVWLQIGSNGQFILSHRDGEHVTRHASLHDSIHDALIRLAIYEASYRRHSWTPAEVAGTLGIAAE